MRQLVQQKITSRPSKSLGLFFLIIVIPFFFGGFHSQSLQGTPLPKPTGQPIRPSADATSLFLPLLIRQSPTTDLSIQGIEITQGIQNSSNTVPLVANRPTVVRIYALTNSETPIPDVSLAVHANQGGHELSNSPLYVGPGSVMPVSSRAEAASSFNVHLPAEWLNGQVELQIQLDPGNTVQEKNETNNSASINLSFTSFPALDIKVIPIEWDGINDYYPAPTSYSYMGPALQQIYPVSQVNISGHSAYYYDGPLETLSGWNDLVDLIYTLRQSERAPAGRIYYGLIPVENNGHTWLQYGSGIQGNGLVGSPAAIGLASSSTFGIDGGNIASHEVGHTLSSLHSPCGTDQGIDRSYPYPGAAIGNFGLDVMKTGEFTIIPDTNKDIMSYCTPTWVSDYTYNRWFQWLKSHAAQPALLPEQASLLVRAHIAANGTVTMLPAYTFTASPEPSMKQGLYRIELISEDGETLSSHFVTPIAYGDSEASLISSLIPLPAQSVSNLRLYKNDILSVQTTLVKSSPALQAQASQMRTPAGTVIHWGVPNIPALIRYSVANDPELNTIALDWRGGEMTLDPARFPLQIIHFEILLADHFQNNIRLDWDNSLAQ